MDLKNKALDYHKKYRGKISTKVNSPIKTKEDLSLAYTPGVAEVSKEIHKNKEKVNELTSKNHTIAVVSDGSAVLGLGNIGPEAALPVMEGKAALFKTFANLDAVSICLDTQDSVEIIKIVKALAPTFGGINLEDISAPRCFEIEESLQDIGIPVMHDDQHGTAVVVLAGLINAVKVVNKELSDLDVVISGAGAAGIAIANLLIEVVNNVVIVDSKGVINTKREDLNKYKKKIAQDTNKSGIEGSLKNALKDSDVFIGVSAPNIVSADDVKKMSNKPIVFALSNPDPEITPDEAKRGGAYVIATGRSDYPNQVNNSLAFPGIFKGALESGAKRITKEMKIAAAHALADMVEDPKKEKIIPGPFDKGIAERVARAVSTR